MSRINWADVSHAEFPAGQSTPRTVTNTADGIIESYGDSVPADGDTGFAPGCTFRHIDGSGDDVLYVNHGTKTSANFEKLDQVPTAYGQNDSDRGPSPAIWKNCPVLEFMLNPTEGWVFFDDFIVKGPVLAANQTVTELGDWMCCTDGTAGSTLTPQADAREGEIVLATTTADEDIIMSTLCGMHNTGQVTFEAGKKTWFEARVKVNNVTDAKIDTFCGFAQEGLVVNAAVLTAADALADVDYVGFVQLAADGDKYQTVYNTSGAGGGVTLSATAATPVINTYHKLGIYCDGTTIYFYFDGVRCADSVALSAAKVPDGEELAFYYTVQNVDGADLEASIDWVRVAQEH